MAERRRLDAAPASAAELSPLPGELAVERLDNGLTVALLANPQAPLVTTALWYRAGCRDDPPGHGGAAHFLEHMMFKGSGGYAAGEIDRRTRALGGSNNAFTSHDVTAYYFDFAADRWGEALAIEADRMRGLWLDADEVASERRVILEEIAMYEAEPWEALSQAVEAAVHPGHPYGRPVLGSRGELAATGGADLAAFHRAYYRPDNAVLVVAGDLGEAPLAAVAAAFGALPAGAAGRPPVPPQRPPAGLERIERRRGEVPRLLLALPAPAAGDPQHAALRLLAVVLGSGRASRLQRALVDEGQQCVWVSADLGETVDAGSLTLALELLPGVEPAAAEERLLAELAALAGGGPTAEEVERARRIALADWVFAHERVHQQALTVGFALSCFDLGHPERQMRRLLAADAATLAAAADRWLRPERGAVLGWSLPRETR